MHNGTPTMKYYIMVWSPLQEKQFDRAIGRIAWEYEKQGFCGGVMVAKSLL